jgi:HEPN domain-containing protein
VKRIASKWLRQAEADLLAAKDSLDHGHHEWACFQCQQAAEKALKAYLYEKGYTSIMTHSLKELVRECSKIEPSAASLSTDARFLDMFYIPTRYPNGLGGDLSPVEFYEKEDAEKCLNSAELILRTVKSYLGA